MAIPVAAVISHWSHYFQSFTYSAHDFYAALGKICGEHHMPNTEIEPVTHKEGGLLSANREYLRIKYHKLVFDICAAPFGKDFFISWWFYETEGSVTNLLKGTKVGSFLKASESAKTFFQIDAEEMFRSCVHECILEAIAQVTEGKTQWQLSNEQKAYKMGA